MLPEIAFLLLAGMAAPAPQCKANPALVGQCFVIHGRLRTSNGNPTLRIWRTGTKRILGVMGPHPSDNPILPGDLKCGFDCDVYADFEVCPFAKEEPEVMQRVCIEAAKSRVTVYRDHTIKLAPNPRPK